MIKNTLMLCVFCFVISACSKNDNGGAPTPAPLVPVPVTPTSIVQNWIIGDTADVTKPTQTCFVLMGGGLDVDNAIREMIVQSGGGDFVILRASGSDGYNSYIFNDLGGVNSCETFLVNSREKAADARLIQRVQQAEAIFIAGGDQANYVNFWKGTPLQDALNNLINSKKIPFGGTSAGCSILGDAYFSAINNTITTTDAIANPFDNRVTLGNGDFLNIGTLSQTITDTHYDNPDRKGRHIVFLARLYQNGLINIKGIGVEEKTAVVINQNKIAQVVGANKAYFLKINTPLPEQLTNGLPLIWDKSARAIKSVTFSASPTLNNTKTFSLVDWQTYLGATEQFFSVKNGAVVIN